MAWLGRLATATVALAEVFILSAARILAWTLGLSLLGIIYFGIGILAIDWLDGRNMSEAAYAHSLGRRMEALVIPFALATGAAIGVWRTLLWRQRSSVTYDGARVLGLWIALIASAIVLVLVPLYALGWDAWMLQWGYWEARPASDPPATRDPVGILRAVLIPGFPFLIYKLLKL